MLDNQQCEKYGELERALREALERVEYLEGVLEEIQRRDDE